MIFHFPGARVAQFARNVLESKLRSVLNYYSISLRSSTTVKHTVLSIPVYAMYGMGCTHGTSFYMYLFIYILEKKWLIF